MSIERNPNNKGTKYQFDSLQRIIGQGNAERGFHDEGNFFRSEVAAQHDHIENVAALRNYYMVKLGLIITEAAEGLEDLRNGRPVNRNYYTIDGEELTNLTSEGKPFCVDGMYASRATDKRWPGDAHTPKPEGVPSEIADIVIRCLDFADEAGFSLIDAILEKLAYNETRERLHGKQV